MDLKIFHPLFLFIFLNCKNPVKNSPPNEIQPKDTLISISPDRGNIIEDTITIKIESIFNDLCSNEKISSSQKYCTFEFKTGDEPHVDVFDSKFELILASIDQSHIKKLMMFFETFCKNCSSNLHEFIIFRNDNKFLVEGEYSIELNYSRVNGEINDIICLIYGNGRYIFFTLGVK